MNINNGLWSIEKEIEFSFLSISDIHILTGIILSYELFSVIHNVPQLLEMRLFGTVLKDGLRSA